MSSEMLNYLKMAGVATVYEAAGRKGLIDLPLHQIVPGSRLVGPARTVLCGQDDNLMVHAVMQRVQPGDVIVVTMPEPRPFGVVGDLLVTQARARGAAGMLIDAAVRDSETLREMGFPVWARWIRARGADKKIVGELDVPIVVGGARIEPGDILVLDADGAVCIAQAQLKEVYDATRTREQRESTIRARYASGELSVDINDLRKILEGPPMRTG